MNNKDWGWFCLWVYLFWCALLTKQPILHQLFCWFLLGRNTTNQIIKSYSVHFIYFIQKQIKIAPGGLVILFQHNSFIFVGWSKRIPCIVTPLVFDPCSLVESDRSPLTNRYSIICVCCDKNDRMEIVIWGPVANSGRGSSDDGDIFCVFCR